MRGAVRSVVRSAGDSCRASFSDPTIALHLSSPDSGFCYDCCSCHNSDSVSARLPSADCCPSSAAVVTCWPASDSYFGCRNSGSFSCHPSAADCGSATSVCTCRGHHTDPCTLHPHSHCHLFLHTSEEGSAYPLHSSGSPATLFRQTPYHHPSCCPSAAHPSHLSPCLPYLPYLPYPMADPPASIDAAPQTDPAPAASSVDSG